MIIAAALLLAAQPSPDQVERNNVALRAWLLCAYRNADRFAELDSVDPSIVATAALGSCGGEEQEARRTMYGTVARAADAERVIDEARRDVKEKLVARVLEIRLTKQAK